MKICMKVLVTGSRDWPNSDGGKGIIYCGLADAIKCHYYPDKPKREDILIIHGGARGADEIADEWARERFVPTKVYIPDWQGQGKKAGILRNQQMLDENPDIDLVIAFWKNKSKGTAHMINYAKKAGKKVIIYEL